MLEKTMRCRGQERSSPVPQGIAAAIEPQESSIVIHDAAGIPQSQVIDDHDNKGPVHHCWPAALTPVEVAYNSAYLSR